MKYSQSLIIVIPYNSQNTSFTNQTVWPAYFVYQNIKLHDLQIYAKGGGIKKNKSVCNSVFELINKVCESYNIQYRFLKF